MNTKSLVFKILGVVIGVGVAVAGCSERSRIEQLKKIGTVAIVEPISEYTDSSSRGNHTYTAEFVFETEDGTTITKKTSFPKELIADFEAGTPVKVFYNPTNPSEFVFEKQEPEWFVVIFGIGIGIAALIFA
ncbi:DUF3592 domain-containing protein [Solimonas sp. K1W22B-7]|uniref:DUF3592 domain-containing protein n=1 Tax=Solimonas sp. K1W22B-7 TaxID=2303331 RepID=UPI0013C486F1|nr:DUF3592 domain-containing protein [Solimonas sp. K1W22B-7]